MERPPMDGPNEPFITEGDEAKWQSMERDAMQCHDGLRFIQYENMRLENKLMQWEDQRSQEAMEARWYQQAAMDVDEEGEPAGPNPPGATTATDASTTEAPSSFGKHMGSHTKQHHGGSQRDLCPPKPRTPQWELHQCQQHLQPVHLSLNQ